MKIIYFSLMLSITLLSCSSNETVEEIEESVSLKYPKDILSVFQQHGGISAWNSMNTLSYEFENEGSVEKQTIDLKSRKIRIEQERFNIGFDGNEVWFQQLNTNNYEGDARFYHNLYFYFYAMPFVLADEGIEYEVAESLVVDSIEYPGIKISYNQNVGDSPEDNYILYYNKETKQAEWLGYTVTYFNGKPSEELHYLQFESWQKVNGLLLPETLTWYNLDLENNTKEERGEMIFNNVDLSSERLSDSLFLKPKGV